MSEDITGRLAEQVFADMALDVKVQLERGTGTRPVLWLLSRARERAAAAFIKFLTVDPNDADSVRILQNQVNQFDDYVTDVRELLARGMEADRLISEDERLEIEEITDASNYDVPRNQ